ncbi:MAG TPA: LCP family protein, partial [Pilimelia sp.]|nr:LCP family protein [Pilimelia sp.]
MAQGGDSEEPTRESPAAGGPAGQAATSSRRRLVWWGAALAALLVLGTGGAVVVGQALRSRYDVPNADLFGTPAAPGAAAPSPTAPPSPTTPPGAGIKGPLNILLVGVDTRAHVPSWRPNADAVMILHVPRSLDRAYLFSLPRDLRVNVPAFQPSGYGGGRTKLTHAMSYGSRKPGGGKPDAAQGFQLLARTVSSYTGITRFDAGAVLDFGGFNRLVDAVGGVDVYIDQQIVSRHRQPDGRPRPLVGGNYTGPQMVYNVGVRHLNGWQALDVARQRYITDGDYARQRHQQQLIKALVKQVMSRGVATDPARLDQVLRAIGKTLVFDGRGRRVIDFAYALRNVRPESITLVGLPGSSVIR